MTDKPINALKPRWSPPELRRLGTMRDIAGGPQPLSQSNSNKRS